MSTAASASPAPPGPRSRFPRGMLTLMAVLTVLVPFLFWRGTWFGQELSDEEIRVRLTDATTNERHIQHALSRLAARIEQDKAAARGFHPLVAARKDHPSAIVRASVAWVCGMDGESAGFRTALQALVADPDLRVARQAALSLSAHGCDAGRPVLRAMLAPLTVVAAVAGTVEDVLAVGEQVQVQNQVVRLRQTDGTLHAQQAPLEGRIASVAVGRGDRMPVGAAVLTMAPDPDAVFQALRALFLIGSPEDLPLVREWLVPREGFAEPVRVQARRAIARIEASAASRAADTRAAQPATSTSRPR